MNFLKKNLKTWSIFLISIFIFSFILNLLFYFGLFSINTVKLLFWIFTMILFLYIGIDSGIRSEKKGYISGLLKGLCYLGIILLISLVVGIKLGLGILLYYISLILCSMAGGMIGINKKDK